MATGQISGTGGHLRRAGTALFSFRRCHGRSHHGARPATYFQHYAVTVRVIDIGVLHRDKFLPG